MLSFVSRLIGRGNATTGSQAEWVPYRPCVEELEARNMMTAQLCGAVALDLAATAVIVESNHWTPRPSAVFSYDIAQAREQGGMTDMGADEPMPQTNLDNYFAFRALEQGS